MEEPKDPCDKCQEVNADDDGICYCDKRYKYLKDKVEYSCQSCRAKIEAEIRQKALIEGITMYAWWKDGVQYVGSCGTTLKEAIAEINRNG
jgi:hypothetical protein